MADCDQSTTDRSYRELTAHPSDICQPKGVSPIKYILILALAFALSGSNPGEDSREVARKPRLEFAGAIYHVISRGNYRKELFEGL